MCFATSIRCKRALFFSLLILLLLSVTLLSIRLSEKPHQQEVITPDKVKGVWIAYFEYAAMIDGKTEAEYQTTIDAVLENLKSVGINTVFLHVRSHSDSLYPSKVFPWSSHINNGEGVDYDPLQLFIKQAHDKGVGVHAWVNPYRISTGTLAELSEDHPAYPMREDGNKVVEIDSGVYYNPSSPEVRALVLSGIRELLECYDIDGIQYDDYFYPTADLSFDRVAYHQYCDQTENPMSQSEWRRCQVNLLVSGTYQLVQQYDDVIFGISPAANVQNNYDTLFADVTAWVEGGYVDYLCPQLYFGFDYPDEAFRFDTLLYQWQTIAGDIPLYIGLASYKVGQTDSGSTEWVTATDILAREIDLAATDPPVSGVCLYNYSSLMKNDPVSVTQRETLTQALSRFQ